MNGYPYVCVLYCPEYVEAFRSVDFPSIEPWRMCDGSRSFSINSETDTLGSNYRWLFVNLHVAKSTQRDECSDKVSMKSLQEVSLFQAHTVVFPRITPSRNYVFVLTRQSRRCILELLCMSASLAFVCRFKVEARFYLTLFRREGFAHPSMHHRTNTTRQVVREVSLLAEHQKFSQKISQIQGCMSGRFPLAE